MFSSLVLYYNMFTFIHYINAPYNVLHIMLLSVPEAWGLQEALLCYGTVILFRKCIQLFICDGWFHAFCDRFCIHTVLL